MIDAKYCYEYPRPAVTIDCIIFGYDNSLEVSILLIKRANEPFKDCWAFPGGFLEMNESAENGVKRELFEETGLDNIKVNQFFTATKVDRDPRGRVISIVYTAKVKIVDCKITAGDDAVDAKWFKLSDIPILAFDHEEILTMAIEKMCH